ncbi:MAG: GTPase, partial [Planctomycetota bacterium]
MSSFVDRLHALRRVASRCSGSSAARVRDRIDRDLVPRTRHGDDWLVCGIVGPNNAGKSALFNGLVGRALSPSVATGAATRRLVAAAHPALARLVRDEEAGGRFAVRTWEHAED